MTVNYKVSSLTCKIVTIGLSKEDSYRDRVLYPLLQFNHRDVFLILKHTKYFPFISP